MRGRQQRDGGFTYIRGSLSLFLLSSGAQGRGERSRSISESGTATRDPTSPFPYHNLGTLPSRVPLKFVR